jgi:S1-C subfamily serine protease
MQDGNYALIYLGGANLYDDWREGEIKAFLSPTSTSRVYKAKWLMLGKDISNDYYITISENSMDVRSDDSNEKYLKLYPTAEMIVRNSVSSGTGFFINTKGYIVTNYHCVESAKSIKVSGVNGDSNKKYNAVVEVTDKQNDLAILKISDSSFRPLTNIPYAFKFTTSNVGEDCFVLGYPLISTMGKDIKLTNGIISSKSGYEGNVSQYQISAPVQPGNSGGPLFDKDGNVIGIVQAKHREAENAGYAIKSSYIRNLVELLPITISFPTNNLLKGKSLPQQVNLASKAVCIVIVNEN